jgi:hypothetical protein
MIDIKLTQLGLKIKNLVVIDLSFPHGVFPEFKKVYDPRYLWMPCRKELVLPFASGLASFGKLVLVYGLADAELKEMEPTVNVKVLRPSPEGTWQDFEESLRRFGPEVLLIPE